MGENSKISWTHHTFSPVRGCRYAVLPDGSSSPACTGCYAESMSKRNPATLGEWGADGARVFGGESYWKQPVKWNADAEKAGERRRVFCASLADIFEGEDRDGVELREGVRPDYVDMLTRLFDLIRATPWLDWLLLTKRPWNMARWAAEHGCPPNVWAGTTVENQAAADDRIAYLLRVPASVRFLSMEPLFGRVDLSPWMGSWSCFSCDYRGYETKSGEDEDSHCYCPDCGTADGDGFGMAANDPRIKAHLSWVIVGGQSGPGAGVLDVAAVQDILNQTGEAEIPVFVKQLGSEWARANGSATRAGTDPSEWPAELQVQEFPHV